MTEAEPDAATAAAADGASAAGADGVSAAARELGALSLVIAMAGVARRL